MKCMLAAVAATMFALSPALAQEASPDAKRVTHSPIQEKEIAAQPVDATGIWNAYYFGRRTGGRSEFEIVVKNQTGGTLSGVLKMHQFSCGGEFPLTEP